MSTIPDDVSADLTGQYLKKQDAVDAPLVLTISSVGKQLFEARAGKPAESKWTITFAGDPSRKMTLNKTNLSILAKAFGAKTASWIGQRVEVYVDEGVMFG